MQEWLTYEEAAERLGVSAEAIRCRAKRHRWQRTRGNDGRARICLPDDTIDRATGGRPGGPRPEATGQARPDVERLIAALEAHIETLRVDLALVRDELTQERRTALEMASAYQRVVSELEALRADQRPKGRPTSTSAPRPPVEQREPKSGDVIETSIESGMAEIRRHLENLRAKAGH